MIDEADEASDYDIFRKFLHLLRGMYLERQSMQTPTFNSVILAGVTDIKNLKKKIRKDSEHQYNSPWNIAAEFNIDMSFHPEEISTMLSSYEKDHNTGMNIKKISEKIYYFTRGYPYLVSYICKKIDEEELGWKATSVSKAAKILIEDDNKSTLLADVIKNVEQNENFREFIRSILINGEEISFKISNPNVDLGDMYGILSEKNSKVIVSNHIFENVLYDYLVAVGENEKSIKRTSDKKVSYITKDGKLDMDLIVNKFEKFMYKSYRKSNIGFIEESFKLIFLSFVSLAINGIGTYAVESETNDNKRMDITIFYEQEEFIIELKMWHGEVYNNSGIEQLKSYLKSQNQNKGWLVSFTDNKTCPKESSVLEEDGFRINETVVCYKYK
jgi:hypothetical protein